MDREQYVFGDTADDQERTRLQLVEAWADSATVRHLRMTGVSAGWRCLEVGAGAGSVTRWLAEEVGPSGAVVATDLNPRFLGDVPTSVDVRTHDITRDELEVDSFDLAHSRLLLMHLPNPAAALDRMISALKPGAWLVTEEADWGLFALDGHPDAAWAADLVHDLFVRHAHAGVRDPYFGRTLPGFVARSSVEVIEADGATDVVRGTDARLYHLTFQALRKVNASVGATEEDLARLDAVLASPDVTITGVTIITARARKPLP